MSEVAIPLDVAGSSKIECRFRTGFAQEVNMSWRLFLLAILLLLLLAQAAAGRLQLM
jgi:hypothetical protein